MGFRKDYSSLVCSYETFKENSFYGVGQRRVKLFLNSLSKKYQKMLEGEYSDDLDVKRNWYLSLIYRMMLETENCNINAKKYRNTTSFDYSDHNYHQKHQLIRELCLLCNDYNQDYPSEKIVFGYTGSDVYNVNFIIYFELPDTGEQISFHTDLDRDVVTKISKYDNGWDGIPESTLWKLEDAICERWGSEIHKKYQKEIEEREDRLRKEKEEDERRIAQREEQLRINRERNEKMMSEASEAFEKNDFSLMMDIYNKMSKNYKRQFRSKYITDFASRYINVKYGSQYVKFVNHLSEKFEKNILNTIMMIIESEVDNEIKIKYPEFVDNNPGIIFNHTNNFINSVRRYNDFKIDSDKMVIFDCPWNKCLYVENFFGIDVKFFIRLTLSKKMRRNNNFPVLFRSHFENELPEFLSYENIKNIV